MPVTPTWSVVVVSFNTGPLLSRCIRSVLDVGGDRVEVVVVDNASADDTLAGLPTDRRVQVVVNDVNVGFPRAVNQGIEASEGTNVLVLNPDTVVPPGLFDALDIGIGPNGFDLVTCSQQGDDGVVAATGARMDLRQLLSLVVLRRRGVAQLGAPRRVGEHELVPVTSGYLSGYCLAGTAQTFAELGGFDPTLFWTEDADLCERAVAAGRTVGVCTTVPVHHERTYSVQRYRSLVVFFQLVSKVGYARRHLSRPAAGLVTLAVLLVAMLRWAWFTTLGRDGPTARTGAAAYAAIVSHVLRRQWRVGDGWDPAVVERLRTTGEAVTDEASPRVVEWAVAILAVVILARSSVLFVRQRLADRFGGEVAATWQDDPLVSTVFLAVEVAALALVARYLRARDVWRHLPLFALLALAFASIEWAIEPTTAQLRAFGFAGTAAVGWFLGTRFTLRQQLDAVILGGAVGIVASAVAVVVLPDQARLTNGDAGQWSGIFINRNLLALVICVTCLAMALRWWSARPGHRVALVALGLLSSFLLLKSGARTAPVAMVSALGVIAVVAGLRHLLGPDPRRIVTGAVASVVAIVAGWRGVLAGSDWLLELLNREPTLHRRLEMWSIDRFYIDQRSWKGWGLESIWTHPPIVNGVFEQYESYPFQAHNGYLEMWLSLGKIGLGVLILLILVTVVRAFRLAWAQATAAALWPLAITAFVVITNYSESLFVANEVQWALFVAAGVSAAQLLRPAPDDATATDSP